MHDLRAVCVALAGYFDAGQISTPSGARAIRDSLPQRPKGTITPPMLWLEVEDGEVVLESGAWQVTHNIEVILALSKRMADPERTDKERQLWCVPLLARTITAGYALGLTASGVKSAIASTYQFEDREVAGDLYDCVVVRHAVIVREAITVAA